MDIRNLLREMAEIPASITIPARIPNDYGVVFTLSSKSERRHCIHVMETPSLAVVPNSNSSRGRAERMRIPIVRSSRSKGPRALRGGIDHLG